MRRITIIGISLALLLYVSLFGVFSCSDNPADSAGSLPGDSWREVYPSQDVVALRHIVTSGTIFVAISFDNRVYTSSDGEEWRQIGLAAGSGTSISDLISTGELLVAVGTEDTLGQIYVSETGDSWRQEVIPAVRHLSSAASNDKVILAVGFQNGVLRKENDSDWESIDIGDNRFIYDVTWAGDRFVGTSNLGILSSVDGLEWVQGTLNASLEIVSSIASSGNSVVTIGDGGGFVTEDGIAWDSIPFFGPHGLFRKIFWEGGRYIAMNGPRSIAFSNNGVTWEQQRISFLSTGLDIAWNGTVYSVTGSSGTRMSAPDSVNWKVHSFRGELKDIAKGDGEFIALGESAPILKSSDGVHWEGMVQPLPFGTNSVVWSGDRYVAVGHGSSIHTSTDGVSWRVIQLTARFHLLAVHADDGGYVAVGANAILFSENGLEWVSVYTDTIPALLEAVTRSESLWLAVGLNGDIMSSPDGRAWTRRESGTTQRLIAADWTGKEFLIAGTEGAILRSADGESWELLNQFNGFGFWVHDAVWANGRYVVVGANGLVITSDDLVNWINRDLEPRTGIMSISWDGKKLVAIHDFDRIIVSP